MNVKLKKFEILEPKVKIKAGVKTITRDGHVSNTPINLAIKGDSAGIYQLGIGEYEEE